MVRVDRTRWRCYLGGRRLHHGLVGAFFIGLGIGLIWHDRRDFPWRFAVEALVD